MGIVAGLFGRHFWILAYSLLLLGFFIPGDYSRLRPLIPLLLGGILFFTSLKVRVRDVTDELQGGRKLGRLSLLLCGKMLLIPIAIYSAVRVVAPDWAVGMLIVCAMPGGLSSATFSDLYRGNVGLALIMVLVGSLICPLSIPLLVQIFDPSAPVTLDWPMVGHQALYIFLLLIIPFTAAQLVRKLAPGLIARHFDQWGSGAILCSVLLGFTSVVVNRSGWADFTLRQEIVPLALTTTATLLSIALGLSLRRIIGAGAATAFAMTCIFMNNGLAVAFVSQFYANNPHVMLPSILMLIPMIAGTAAYGWWAVRTTPKGESGKRRTN